MSDISMRDGVRPLPPGYREAIRFSLVQQLLWTVLCLLLLDGGRMARVCGIALIAYWTFALATLVFRPLAPGSRDITFLRWGFLPLFLVTAALAHLVG